MNRMRAFKACFVTLQSGLTDFLAFPWSEFPHFLVVNFPPVLHAKLPIHDGSMGKMPYLKAQGGKITNEVSYLPRYISGTEVRPTTCPQVVHVPKVIEQT